MNSLQAFEDASQLFDGQVRSVKSFGTSHSVWLCSNYLGESKVLKYFPKNDHGAFHYQVEKDLIKRNQISTIIPKLIAYDDQNQWFATNYVENCMNSKFQLSDLISILNSEVKRLNVHLVAHKYPQGLLNQDQKSMNLSPIQKIIYYELRKFEWFSEYLEEIRGNWGTQNLIHGDIKLSNILMGDKKIIFVDWESVTRGSPEWDYVGLLQSIVMECMGKGISKEWALLNLEECISMIVKLEEYGRKCLVIRLVQSAFEYSSISHQIPRVAVNLLQIADFVANKNFEKLVENLKNVS